MANQKWHKRTVKFHEKNGWTYDLIFTKTGAVETGIAKVFATQTADGRRDADLIFKSQEMKDVLIQSKERLMFLLGVTSENAKDVINGKQPTVLGVQHLEELRKLILKVDNLVGEHE